MRTGFLLTQGSHARRLMLAEGMGIKRAPDAAVLIAVFSARRQYPVSADDVVHSRCHSSATTYRHHARRRRDSAALGYADVNGAAPVSQVASIRLG